MKNKFWRWLIRNGVGRVLPWYLKLAYRVLYPIVSQRENIYSPTDDTYLIQGTRYNREFFVILNGLAEGKIVVVLRKDGQLLINEIEVE
jgi:hypothetical protein